MKITKFGHSCMLIEEDGIRILTDPGTYSTEQNSVKNIHAILVTHEHPDHLHVESLKTIIKHNSGVEVLTNSAVGAVLDKEGIGFRMVEDGGKYVLHGGSIVEGCGKEHALVHRSIPVVHNTGYMIAGRLFYPGDSFVKPKNAVEILALPVAGPWLKLGEAIDYALEIKPKICFPIHEGMLKSPSAVHRIPGEVLGAVGIQFVAFELGKMYEF